MEAPTIVQDIFFFFFIRNNKTPGVGCECVISLYPSLPSSSLSSGTFTTHKAETIHS